MRLGDLVFTPYITADVIAERVRSLALELYERVGESDPVFLVLLQGAFVFAADLMRAYPGNAEVYFTRLRSYSGTEGGEIELFTGIPPALNNRHVIIVEDIVDSGRTVFHVQEELEAYRPASVTIVALLQKKILRPNLVKADMVGFEIPEDFVVGYGLDYNEMGRGLPDIYVLKK
ncbi:MAG: phosphoribosyltransferase family protein [Chitinophagales bacterium]